MTRPLASSVVLMARFLRTRLGLGLLIVLAVAACSETPVGPEVSATAPPASEAPRRPLEVKGDPPFDDVPRSDLYDLFKDAITFTPGTLTLWPHQQAEVEVRVNGNALRLSGQPLVVTLEVPWALKVAGAAVTSGASGRPPTVTIPAGQNSVRFTVASTGLGSGNAYTIRGRAGSFYRPGALTVRVETWELLAVAEEFEAVVSLEAWKPRWQFVMTPDRASLDVCDRERITVERQDWLVNTPLDVPLGVPTGLRVEGQAVWRDASGIPYVTIPAGRKTQQFDVVAEAGSLQPYVLTAAPAMHYPDSVLVDVAVPSLQLSPSSETVLVGEQKPITVSRSAGDCQALAVTVTPSGSGIGVGGGSGQAQTVTIPAHQPSTTFTLRGFGGGSHTVTASAGAHHPASLTATVPTLSLRVVGDDEQLVTWGQPATYTLEVSGQHGFNQAVEVEATGSLPTGVTASVHPRTVTLTPQSTTQQVTLTLDTVEGGTELREKNNGRAHRISVRARPAGPSSPTATEDVGLSVYRTDGAFAAFSMSPSANPCPNRSAIPPGAFACGLGTLNLYMDGNQVAGPLGPFLGYGFASHGRSAVVSHPGSNGAPPSQTLVYNMDFPLSGRGLAWSSQNSSAYSTDWRYSPDNSLVLLVARDCRNAPSNTACNHPSVPLLVTLVDAAHGGRIGSSQGVGIVGGMPDSITAVRVERTGTEQSVIVSRSHGSDLRWRLTR